MKDAGWQVAVLIAAILGIMFGYFWGKYDDVIKVKPTPPLPAIEAIEYRLPHGNVHEFNLKDGTRCVVFDYRGGITCEWKK